MGTIQIILSIILSIAVLVGISMMSKVRTAVAGNLISAFAILIGVVATLFICGAVNAWTIYPAIIIGLLIGSLISKKVKMMQMPQTVALFNGLGGGASALVGIMTALLYGFTTEELSFLSTNGAKFIMFTSLLAIAVGMITLIGSLVAAGKLSRILNQRPVVWPGHSAITMFLLILAFIFIILGTIDGWTNVPYITGVLISSSLFGLFFSVRVGGADMPITISLLNSLSGVAGAIAGMAISNILLVAVGGIVGASGLLLTQIMCRAMNRNLLSILLGRTSKQPAMDRKEDELVEEKSSSIKEKVIKEEPVVQKKPGEILAKAKDVIIVPGYGMALAQAQHLVKLLADKLEARGARVRFAIHPVAGRMPGHMNVLLAEANVPYEQLFEMEAINEDFAKTDAVVVIGANDVMNPAARNAKDTPIYGMPVLNVDRAPEVIICNFDLKPGYAGVDNPLYSRKRGVYLLLGDAKESLNKLMTQF